MALGSFSDDMSQVITNVTQACEICARFGPLMVRRNLSIYHIKEEFNVVYMGTYADGTYVFSYKGE